MPHIHEQYDFTIGVFIVHKDKVLLVYHPRYNKWLAPGGHIELDEDPEEALYREIKEETGLDVEIVGSKLKFQHPGTKIILAPRYIDVHEANPPHKHISLVYYGKAKTNKHIKSDEHSDMRWFSKAELSDPRFNIPPPVKFGALDALKVLA